MHATEPNRTSLFDSSRTDRYGRVGGRRVRVADVLVGRMDQLRAQVSVLRPPMVGHMLSIRPRSESAQLGTISVS
jgi:hypothetical protein